MTKEWPESQLNEIYRDNHELRKGPIVGLDVIVVEFLNLHDVETRLPKNTSKRDGAIAVAITGMAGADIGGDAFLIQGQAKQTQLQEWTSWKQWALSYNSFPEFKKKFNGEAEAKNKEIDEKLVEPAFVEKWEAYFKKAYEEESVRKIKANRQMSYALLALISIIAAIVGITNNPEIMEKLQPSTRELSSLPESDFYQTSIKY